MSTTTGILLFGHGARDPAWARPMERAREHLVTSAPEIAVELGFLEFMQPGLGEAIDRLVARGAERITVVPMFLAQGGHLKNDLPVLLEAAREKHPSCEIRQTLAAGESETVIAAMAEYAVKSAAA